MPTHLLRYSSLLLALAWAAVIYHLSSQPGTDMPALFFGQDKLLHFTAYGILGFLVMGAAKAGARGYTPRQAWLTAALVTLYGVLDEFHQYFVPGREADAYDVLADMAGGMAGVWLLYYLISNVARREK